MQPRASTRRAFPGFGQLLLVEREATPTAAGGQNLDTMTGRAGGANRVAEILFHVGACQAKLPRQR